MYVRASVCMSAFSRPLRYAQNLNEIVFLLERIPVGGDIIANFCVEIRNEWRFNIH